MNESLPVPVLEYPHWRVNFRPQQYQKELIPSLHECFALVEQTKVGLRGWDYPFVSRKRDQQGQGNNWVASWVDFLGNKEYWRLYQSGQFIHLFAVKEAAETEWKEQLQRYYESHLRCLRPGLSNPPGFIHIQYLLYKVAEIYEFAARLSQRGLYDGAVSIDIELIGVQGFVLVTEWGRFLFSCYAASEDRLQRVMEYRTDDLIARSAEHSLHTAQWFYERFGWLEPPVDSLRKDQERFLAGTL